MNANLHICVVDEMREKCGTNRNKSKLERGENYENIFSGTMTICTISTSHYDDNNDDDDGN
jgi:hypothetical protein